MSERIKGFIERIERLDSEIADLNSDKAEVFKEARSDGWDVPAMRAVIAKRRKMARDPNAYAEQQQIIALYEAAVETGTVVATRARAQGVAPEPPAKAHLVVVEEAPSEPAPQLTGDFPDMPPFLARQ